MSSSQFQFFVPEEKKPAIPGNIQLPDQEVHLFNANKDPVNRLMQLELTTPKVQVENKQVRPYNKLFSKSGIKRTIHKLPWPSTEQMKKDKEKLADSNPFLPSQQR